MTALCAHLPCTAPQHSTTAQHAASNAAHRAGQSPTQQPHCTRHYLKLEFPGNTPNAGLFCSIAAPRAHQLGRCRQQLEHCGQQAEPLSPPPQLPFGEALQAWQALQHPVCILHADHIILSVLLPCRLRSLWGTQLGQTCNAHCHKFAGLAGWLPPQ